MAGSGSAERSGGWCWSGVAAAEFGVGGDSQVALGAGGGFPVGAVDHGRGEYGLALPVGPVQGVIACREFLLAGGGGVVAATLSSGGFGGGAQADQAGLRCGGADLAELIADVLRRPGGLDGVGVAQVQQLPVGQATDVRVRQWGRGRPGPGARPRGGPGRGG